MKASDQVFLVILIVSIVAALIFIALQIADTVDQPVAVDPLMGEHCLDARHYNYKHHFWFDEYHVVHDFGDGRYQVYYFCYGDTILPWFSTTADSLKAWGG